MRKCHMCGYLALTEGEVCKHCGALLPRVMAAALAAGGSPVAEPPPPRAPVPERAPVAREYWSPPPPASAPTNSIRSTPRVLLALVAIASMALGWVAVDHLFTSDQLPAGTSAFVAGHGIAYSSPDHTLEASFPIAPTVEAKPISVASTVATLNLAQAQTDDYEVVAASMVLPVSVPADQVDAALHDILNEGAAAEGAKILSEKHITSSGVPGIEVRAKVSDGCDARLTVLISGTHVYLAGVHAKSGTSRLYDALLRSLIMY